MIPEPHEILDELSPKERMLYWITERHEMFLRRQAGQPKPWTADPIMQRWFFTNPFRENDRVTRWFKENLRDPVRDDPIVAFTTAAFRWYNHTGSGAALLGPPGPWLCRGCQDPLSTPTCKCNKCGVKNLGLWTQWKPIIAARMIKARSELGMTYVGSGYLIKVYNSMKKYDGLAKAINNVWRDRFNLMEYLTKPGRSLEQAWTYFKRYPFMGGGGFIAYETVTDLRHTDLLCEAPDILTWCNLGPGAKRGIARLVFPDEWEERLQQTDGKVTSKTTFPVPHNYRQILNDLREWFAARLPKDFPPFEMRDLEHSLCEFDKYERARLNQGRMKRTYDGR